MAHRLRRQCAFIGLGKPWQNDTNDSFNGRFRDACLNMEWFRNRREAAVIIKDWRMHFNAVRSHPSLRYQTPQEFERCTNQSRPQHAPRRYGSRNPWSEELEQVTPAHHLSRLASSTKRPMRSLRLYAVRTRADRCAASDPGARRPLCRQIASVTCV